MSEIEEKKSNNYDVAIISEDIKHDNFHVIKINEIDDIVISSESYTEEKKPKESRLKKGLCTAALPCCVCLPEILTAIMACLTGLCGIISPIIMALIPCFIAFIPVVITVLTIVLPIVLTQNNSNSSG